MAVCRHDDARRLLNEAPRFQKTLRSSCLSQLEDAQLHRAGTRLPRRKLAFCERNANRRSALSIAGLTLAVSSVEESVNRIVSRRRIAYSCRRASIGSRRAAR